MARALNAQVYARGILLDGSGDLYFADPATIACA